MTVKGGSRPACAACRFQRRRCSPDCPLAPYFPANQPKIFQNVHRLYGVGNIMKILKQLKDAEEKQEAMKSIKYESYIRQIYRVDGCYGTIICLQQQLVQTMRELQYVRFLVETYRRNDGCKPLTTMQDPFVFSSSLAENEGNNCGSFGGSGEWRSETMTMNREGDGELGFYYDGISGDGNASEVVRRVMESQPYENWGEDRMETDGDSVKYRTFLDGFQSCSVEEGEGSPDYAEMTCGLLVDDPHSQIESKEAYELSSESYKDTSYFTEPEESKTDKDLFQVQQGVRRLTMEY